MTADVTTPTNETETSPSARPGMGLVKAYLGVYAILAVVYIFFLVTAGEPMKHDEFWKQVFPSFDPTGTAPLTEEDFDEEHGHLLLWKDVSFQEGPRRHMIPADEKISAPEAVALGKAIRSAETPEGAPELVVNRHHIMRQTWAYGLTIYNLLGLFLLLIVFLRDPLTGFLDTKREQTAEDLKHAREAMSEAERIEERRKEILAEVEAKRKEMEATAEEEFAEEREHIIESARHEADGMLANLKDRLDAEVTHAANDLRREVAEEAYRLAQQIVDKQADEAVHDEALRSFVEDVRKADIG